MKSWKVLLAISLAIFANSWFIVSPETKTFSVLSQRVDTSKSSAITDICVCNVKFIDMIWE